LAEVLEVGEEVFLDKVWVIELAVIGSGAVAETGLLGAVVMAIILAGVLMP
jgi:hypothetical protein